MTALVRLAHVGANEDSPAAVVRDFLGNRMATLFVAAGDRDFGALFGEEDRSGRANPGCAPGDQRDFMFQAHALNLSPPDLPRPPPAPPRLQRMPRRWQDRVRRAQSLPACPRVPEDACAIRREIDPLPLPIAALRFAASRC